MVVVAAMAALALLLSGCGRNDQYRGHNANMIGDGLADVRKVLKKEAPRLYAEHPTLKRDLDDIEDRNDLSKKDHKWKGAKIERHTPEKPSPQDVNLFCSYSAVADRKDSKRKASEERWAWWHRLVWWVKAFLYAAPFVGILWLFLYFRRRFWQFGEVQVKHIAATVKDKGERQAIAGGSPTERIFKQIKSILPWGGATGPQEPRTCDKSESQVAAGPEAEKSRESEGTQ